MAPAFHPDHLRRMFEAFDLARKVSPDDPDVVAERIIGAAGAGVDTVDGLFAAAIHSPAPAFTTHARLRRSDPDAPG